MTGSSYPEGPGWWQANDGKYYPPPNPAASAAAPPPLPQYAAGPQSSPSGTTDEGFFPSLFDMSFTKFMTPKLIKVLYILAIVVFSLYSLLILVSFLGAGGPAALIGLIGAPLLWFIGVIYSRVMLEVVMVLFRIERNTRKGE